MDILGAFLVVGVLSVVAIGLALSTTQRRRGAISDIAIAIGGRADRASVTGARHGVAVELRFTTRSGPDSSSESWTEIDAELPAKYPLAIYVRRHGWRDRAKIERGKMVDLELGD